METNKPTTQVVFKHEEKKQLEDFSSMLETLAAKLRNDQSFTIVHNGETYNIQPNKAVTVELKYSTKGVKHSFEIELEWIEGQTSAQLDIR